MLRFDPFDSSLGTLTAAVLNLQSSRDLQAGVGVAMRPGSAVLNDTAFENSISLSTGELADDDVNFALFGCRREASDCFALETDVGRFDLVVDVFTVLSPTAAPEFTLLADMFLGGVFVYSGGIGDRPNFVAVSQTLWSGNVSLTYFYTAVPEPQTWAIMIGGFALAGSTARFRRRAQAGLSRG